MTKYTPVGSEEQPERLVLHWGDPAAWRDTVWQHLQAWAVPRQDTDPSRIHPNPRLLLLRAVPDEIRA